MTLASQCQAVYRRPTVDGRGGELVYCHYIKDHPKETHSWETLRLADQESDTELPGDVKAIVNNIASGQADPYLEIILAATHGRKRALRGTPGFRR